jgi:hypothetical protein
MSSNGMKKESQIAGKGHNMTLEIVNPVNHTRTASEKVDVHVPGNGSTCHPRILSRCSENATAGVNFKIAQAD